MINVNYAMHDVGTDRDVLGECDSFCNQKVYGWDGGDCKRDPIFSACPAAWRGNGKCDEECNNKQSGWDLGDCALPCCVVATYSYYAPKHGHASVTFFVKFTVNNDNITPRARSQWCRNSDLFGQNRTGARRLQRHDPELLGV